VELCRALVPVLCCWLAAVAAADAWGPAGHRAVAEIAAARLTPSVHAAARHLLGGATLADVAVWADDVRETTHPQTANWHFVNTPIAAEGYVASRDCVPLERGDCILAALRRVERQLADEELPRTRRREALMFLVHLMGDLHQPLHVGHNGDRGGNSRVIARIGGAVDLHRAWDSGIIRASGGTVRSLVRAAAAWLRTQDQRRIAQGSYEDWAAEGVRIARDVAYAQAADDRISPAERRQALAIVEQRIAVAGVRLAFVLDRALAAQRPAR
jgi:hypothetical protein